MLLLEAQKYLTIVRKRGEEASELRRVYYNIATNKELYLQAYMKLYANDGAMTPGIIPEDTVDGMSAKRIETLMEQLKTRTYQWTPVRRTYLEKTNSTKKRPLGMPGFNDKLLEEVIRMVLEAYYEPQFRKSSYGFRPQRGCQTAREAIAKWKGTRWFIEGDIKGCFDHLNHGIILKILRKRIKDETFLRLIREMLEAGYMENWVYHKTYSGTPQGGIVSPLIANIVLNEFDKVIEDEFIPEYTKGTERRFNKEYVGLASRARRARKGGNWAEAKRLRKIYTKLPSRDPNDPEFRRLWYVRYADDFLVGFIGTRHEAEEIKEKIGIFLKSMKLEMSAEKTFITKAMGEKARFLNYQINRMDGANQRMKVKKHRITGTHTQRTINQMLYFSIPQDVIEKWMKKVAQGKEITQRGELVNLSDYDIMTTDETELQGLINYYSQAHNQGQWQHLRHRWKESLLKTLAHKHKTTLSLIRKRYERFYDVNGRRLTGVEVEREGKKPLRAIFGRKPIQRHPGKGEDNMQHIYITHNGLIDRLLAEKCELCGREELDLEGHHVRKLKDLNQKWAGKKEKPTWISKMIAIRRKTLFVCKECHQKIHTGTYDGKRLT